jgi:hypothetical protein
MTAAQPHRVVDRRFGALYLRLVTGLGVVCLGGWVALLLEGRGDGIAALVVLVGSAMLAGQRAGALGSGFVLLEVTFLVALALQVPLLLYVWADLGPLTLVAIAAIQVPFALIATLIAHGLSPSADG